MAAITVIGTGYVGLATAVCLAELGHRVTGLDIDAEKIGKLRQGMSPIYEPGLVDLLGRGMAAGRLSFTTDYAEAVPGAEFVFIAVATPMGRRGDADIVFVKQAAQSIAKAMRAPLTIVNKSTVPIGTGDIISRIVHENLGTEIPFQVICNPEFLREGTAIQDFMHPDRLVLGAHDRAAAEAVATVYERLDAPVLFTDLYTAEMIKYASNAFLATRISFINEIARICERVDADVKVVAEGMGMDRRIGPLFLEAGIGYGGSCFPKDVKALARMAETMGYHPELLDTVMEINEDQRKLVVDKLREVLGSVRDQTIGVLGLAYKPNTDDIREAPAISVIQSLLEKGAHVRAYDPAAVANAKRLLNSSIDYCEDAYATAQGADALLLVTEWDEFRHLDFDRIKPLMRRPVLVDGRNIYDPRAMRDRGFIYRGVGR
jgi:UDPglucose 6-dehydrogenase